MCSEESSAVERIVVGVDGSASSRAALRFGAHDALLRGATVVPLLAETLDPEDVTEPHSPAIEAGMSSLAMLLTSPAAGAAMEVVSPVRVRGGSPRLERVVAEELGVVRPPVETEAWEGHPARVLVERSSSALALVVGSRGGGGFRGLRLGSVAQQVLHRATCPVVVVRRGWRRPSADASVGPVVAGFDAAGGLSPPARAALRFAAEEAAMRKVTLEVVAVQRRGRRGDGPGGAEALERLLAQEVDLGGMPVEVTVRTGNAAKVLVDASRDATLLVVAGGRHGAGGLEPGSVRQQVVHHARCPVAIIGPPIARLVP